MERRDYIGSKAISALITAVTILAALCIILGSVLLCVAIKLGHSYMYLLFYGLYAALASMGLFVLKAILRGFESMVIASEMYIEQMEIESEKCAKSVQGKEE